jgi:type I restriction enzyme S subunit
MKRVLFQIGGSGATRAAITKALAAELILICPPVAIQRSFATRIQSIESLKATHRVALAESDALFASLQDRAIACQF